MKKFVILAWACISLLAVSLTPAQAQLGFNLDFTGGAGSCVSWIISAGGGSLGASQSGGSDSILSTNNAGGAAPECNLSPMTAIYINLVGFTADSLSLMSTGGLDITLYSGGCCSTVVYAAPAGAGTFSVTGITYDTIEIVSFPGSDVDNIVIGTAPTSVNPVDPRINVNDMSSPVALYCTEGGGLDIYNIVDNQGVLAHRISDQVLANSIATAIASGNNVLLIDEPNAQVWVLASGEIQVNTGGSAYGFSYQSVCGALPEPELVSGSEIEDEEDSAVIINRPR